MTRRNFSLKKLKKQIQSYFKEQADVLFVYIFGSVVGQRIHQESDVDIAVFYEKKPDPERLLTTRSELETLIGMPVDLVVLNSVNPVLQYQIIVNGLIIFSRDELARYRFIIQVYNMYDDLTYYQKRIQRQILENPVLE